MVSYFITVTSSSHRLISIQLITYKPDCIIGHHCITATFVGPKGHRYTAQVVPLYPQYFAIIIVVSVLIQLFCLYIENVKRIARKYNVLGAGQLVSYCVYGGLLYYLP